MSWIFQDGEARFELYLAAGDGMVVRPTALNVGNQGRVLIGCENGSIFRCEPEETESSDDETTVEDNGDTEESIMSPVITESVAISDGYSSADN